MINELQTLEHYKLAGEAALRRLKRADIVNNVSTYGYLAKGPVFDNVNAQHNRHKQEFQVLRDDGTQLQIPGVIFIGDDKSSINIGWSVPKQKVKRRRKKMSAKFIKFNNRLINICDMQYFIIDEPESPACKYAVRAEAEEWSDSEYFNTLEEAKARLDAIYAQLAG